MVVQCTYTKSMDILCQVLKLRRRNLMLLTIVVTTLNYSRKK